MITNSGYEIHERVIQVFVTFLDDTTGTKKGCFH